MYICVPDGRLSLHGGEAGSKKETCRTHLKRGKKHGTNSAKARHQHGPGATEGTGKVRRPASLHCIPLLNLRTTAVQLYLELLEHEMILERVRYLEVRRSQDTRER